MIITVEDGKGNVVEQTVDNGDGTATFTEYNAKGAAVRTAKQDVPPVPDDVRNADDLRTRTATALGANRAFLASTPTAAQSAAQVKALTRQMNGLIRLQLQQFDATD